MYQVWLKEREKLIKAFRENNAYLDEIIDLKKKLTDKINLLTLKDEELAVFRKII